MCSVTGGVASKDTSDLRDVLLQEYTLAVKRYASVVRALSKQRASLSRNDCATMCQIADESRQDCERLRTALTKVGGRRSSVGSFAADSRVKRRIVAP